MATHGEINPSTADLILGTATTALDTARGLQTRRTGSVYVDDGSGTGGGIVFGEQAAGYDGAARVDADGNMSPLVDTSQLEQDIKHAGDEAQSAVDSAAQAITQASQSAQAAADAVSRADEAAAQAAAAAGVANAASDKADTASDKADAAASQASTASDSANAASDKADAAASQASTAATTANAASDKAGLKSTVLIQSSAPDAQYQSSLTLWIDTTGGANTPKRWSGSAWVAVTDKQAVDAAAKAVEAKTAADIATAAAKSAATDASTALTNANTALARATHVTTGQSAPTENVVTGDIWFPTNAAGNVTGMKTWGGSKWVDVQLMAGSILVPGSVGATVIADGAITTPKLTVTEDMMVKLLKAHKIKAGEIDLNTLNGNTINGLRLNGSTITGGVIQTSASGYRLKMTQSTGTSSSGEKITYGSLSFLNPSNTKLGELGLLVDDDETVISLGGGNMSNIAIQDNGGTITVSADKAYFTGSEEVLISSNKSITLSANTVKIYNATLEAPKVTDRYGTATVSTEALNHAYATYKFCRSDGKLAINAAQTYMQLTGKTGSLVCITDTDEKGYHVTSLNPGTYHVQADLLISDTVANAWHLLRIEVGGSAKLVGMGRGDSFNAGTGNNSLHASGIVKISKTTDLIRVVASGNKTATMRDNGCLAITRI